MPKIVHEELVAAIRSAEARTSGEIRVLVARHVVTDPVAAAKHYFRRLGMVHSPHRNGVLIFLAPRSRNFAVIGDKAVHEKCGDSFWTSLAETMSEHFRRREFTAGLVHGIDRAGTLLSENFPRTGADPAPGEPQAGEVD